MAILVTGAGGYLGGRLAAALRADGAHGDVITLDRAQADLTVPGALDRIPAAGITHVVHAAAVTRFGVEATTAASVNVRGTQAVVEFARRCRDLERLVLMSTLYTAGTATGEIPEEPREPGPFANHYEWSKHAAEQLILACGLPATIARVATIAADDDSGHVTQFNAVHNTLKLLFYGLLSLMPGESATPVALATADFAVAAMAALLDAEPGVYHVCPDPDRVMTLGELVETTFTVFERDHAFTRRRILRPLFAGEAAFADLLAAVRGMRQGPVADALESVAPFAAQLYRPKVFATTRLRKAWPACHPPDPDRLVTATANYLVETRWGRTS